MGFLSVSSFGLFSKSHPNSLSFSQVRTFVNCDLSSQISYFEGVALFGIWENGFVFWDFSGDGIWHSIDGWVATHDEVPKRQANFKGMVVCAVHLELYCVNHCFRNGYGFLWNGHY